MKYRFLYLIWLLPSYLAFIMVQQANVYLGTINTYANGTSIAADVTDFDVKQIAAQSNGYVVINFKTPDGEILERKLSLSIQMAQRIMDTQVIPIRYQPDTYQEIVMIPTYDLQKSTSLVNMVIALIGLLAVIFASVLVTKFANKRASGNNDDFDIERVDA